MRRSFSLIVVLHALALAALPTLAQVATGTPPFGSFGGGPDIINLANLNAHIVVPVRHRPGRGTNFTYDLTYDTSVWYPVGASGSQSWQSVQNWGFAAQTQVTTGQATADYEGNACMTYISLNNTWVQTGFHFTYNNWIYIDAFGVQHPFNASSSGGWGNCGGSAVTVYNISNLTAPDGSGYSLTTAMCCGGNNSGDSVTITSRSGTVINPPINSAGGVGNFTDRNGNQITVDGSGNFFDTLSSSTRVLSVGGSGTPSSPTTFTYTAPNNSSPAYTMKYTAQTVQTKFGCSSIAEYGPTSNNLVSEIDLPDGSKYSFAYETTPGDTHSPHYVTGRLASITLPTGGTITYTYTGGSTGHITCADGSASGVSRQTPDGTWTYTRTMGAGAASTTTITAPKLSYDSAANQTTIQFQGIYETKRQVYQGSTSGTLLETTNTCYNGAASPCTATAITLPITSRIVLDQIGASGPTCKHVYDYNTFGLLTEQDDYDYSTGTPTTILRKEIIAYASLGNGIVDRPSSITIEDGGSTVKAKTTFCYDEGTPSGTTTCASTGAPTATSGTPQHASISGSRGNATTIAQLVQGTTYLGKKITYYDTGTVNASTDVNGAVTTFVYGTASCGNSFPTSINEPLSMSRSIAWNCNGGVQSSVTDENSKVTSTTWTDPDFWHPAATNFPDGGQTSITYNSQTSVTATTKMNSSQNIVGTVLLDGLGRTQQTQSSDPEGVAYVDTTYDVLGRVATVTNPHRSTSSTTDGTTSYAYDALSRTTSVTAQDGSKSTISYSNNTVTATDPAGKARKSVYDSLGRITQLFEDPAGLNYETDYTFDALSNLLTVNQKGGSTNSANWRTRTFGYDDLSRLTSENTQEAGPTTYNYDSDSNCASPNSSSGDLVSRTDARGIRTCLQYDALHRLTQKNYSDGTLTAFFAYGQTSAWSNTLTNTVGRLTEEWSGTSCCAQGGAAIFSYDPMGRITFNEQWAPTMSYRPVNYAYDLAGSMTSYTSGGITFTQAIDTAGRATQLTSSLVDANHPSPLATVDSSLGYYPTSQMRKLTFGNGLTGANSVTATLQTCRINLNSSGSAITDACQDGPVTGTIQDFDYAFGAWGSTNNGNVTIMDGAFTQGFARTFTYDALNRLATMSDSNTSNPCRGLQWTYDAWGNRTDQTQTAGACGQFHTSINTRNQLYDPVNNIYQYDAAGNLTADGSHTYFYDAENRLIQVDGTLGTCSTATACYLYDALGRRSEKTVAGTPRDFLYDFSGNVLNEYTQCCQAVDYFYLNGQLVGEYENGVTYWLHKDHLGSTRLVTGLEQNQIPNPGFEQGMTNWLPDTGPTIVTDATKAHSSSNYLYISTSTGAEATSSQQVAVTAGQVVTFGGWVYRESGSGGYSRWSIEVLDQTKTIITYINCPNVTTAAWTFNQTTYTIPSGAAYVQLYASIYLPTDLTAVRFDDGFLYIQGSGVSIVQNLDYLPFGDLNSTDSGITTHKFTGDERDSETSLDHTWFRQYSSQFARWTSPDPAGLAAVDPSNPQSWNRYSYVNDDPLDYVDPWGLGSCGDAISCVIVFTNPSGPSFNDGGSAGGGYRLPCGGFLSSPCNPASLPPVGFTLGIRQQGQTWKQCMSANKNAYSIGGSVELVINVATGTNSSISESTSIVTGNGITDTLFGDPSEEVAKEVATKGGLAVATFAAGDAVTYGRRTSQIMSLNLAGKGGLPKALSSSGAKGLLKSLGKTLNAGLDEAEKFAADLGLGGAEAIGCSIPAGDLVPW